MISPRRTTPGGPEEQHSAEIFRYAWAAGLALIIVGFLALVGCAKWRDNRRCENEERLQAEAAAAAARYGDPNYHGTYHSPAYPQSAYAPNDWKQWQ